MIPSSTRIFVATEPADMRRGIDGFARCVRERLAEDPTQRALFVFTNRRCDRAKILWRDTTGWCLLYKRLDTRTIVVPTSAKHATSITVDSRALSALLDGVERSTRRPTTREIVREARRKIDV